MGGCYKFNATHIVLQWRYVEDAQISAKISIIKVYAAFDECCQATS